MYVKKTVEGSQSTHTPSHFSLSLSFFFSFSFLKAASKISKHSVFQNEISHSLSTAAEQLNYQGVGFVNSPERHVRTRLYFTSESHIHSLVNVLRYGYGAVASSPRAEEDPAPGSVVAASTTSSSGSGNEETTFAGILREQLLGAAATAAAPTGGSVAGVARPGAASPLSAVPTAPSPPPTPWDNAARPSIASITSVKALGSTGTQFPSAVAEGDDSVGHSEWETSLNYFGHLAELNYLTHIVCRLYERLDVPADSERRVCGASERGKRELENERRIAWGKMLNLM